MAPRHNLAAVTDRFYSLRAKELNDWFIANKRPLPWRESRDPYRIWISEVMLQQTTVTAVIPYYRRFLDRFPNLETLSASPLENVLELWAGLGYYSRARALHKSAQELTTRGGFPKTYSELIKLSGFGPYTSRAVSSLAFAEPVGVVDGNVVRVISRLFDLDLQWWKPKVRDELQVHADKLAQAVTDSSTVNQGLMELGATICTPSKNPSCMICPWMRSCLARKNSTIDLRPTPKPRKSTEFWVWDVHLVECKTKSSGHIRDVLLIENNYAPFLKGHLVPLGKVRKEKQRPKKFDFKGAVTHHEIFVRVNKVTSLKTRSEAKKLVELSHPSTAVSNPKYTWVTPSEFRARVPSSLVRKALDGLNTI